MEFQAAGIYEISLLMKQLNKARKFQAELAGLKLEEPVSLECPTPEFLAVQFKALSERTKHLPKPKH